MTTNIIQPSTIIVRDSVIRGPAGPQGPTGIQGPSNGPQGAQGIQGSQGTQGSQGSQGTQGSKGFQGAQGLSGAFVSQGWTGRQGTQGSQGTTGIQGRQGTQGTQGTQGLQGRDGSFVAQGLQGSQGTQGLEGFQGTQGTQGIQGSQGLQGSQGIQGSQGSQGTQGAQGLQGPQASQGTQGLQGKDGAYAAQGYQGPQGVQGSQGTQGPQASQGTQGIQGNQGVQGTFGPGFTFKGTVSTFSNLPTSGRNLADAYVTSDTKNMYIWDGNNWINAGNLGIQGIQGPAGSGGTGGTGASVYIGTNPPSNPAVYPLWWESDSGTLKIYYTDADSSQWVDATPATVGIQGAQGIQGLQGLNGAYAAQGYQGPQGTQGIQSAQGTQGIQGPAGSGSSGGGSQKTLKVRAVLTNLGGSGPSAITYAAGTSTSDGGSGVGATLTGGLFVNGPTYSPALADNVQINLGDNILVNTSNGVYNGVYTLTQTASGSSRPFIYTRNTSYDGPGEVNLGDTILVTEGFAWGNTRFIQSSSGTGTNGAIKVGVDPMTFQHTLATKVLFENTSEPNRLLGVNYGVNQLAPVSGISFDNSGNWMFDGGVIAIGGFSTTSSINAAGFYTNDAYSVYNLHLDGYSRLAGPIEIDGSLTANLSTTIITDSVDGGYIIVPRNTSTFNILKANVYTTNTGFDLISGINTGANTVQISQNSGSTLYNKSLNFVNTSTVRISVTNSGGNANIEFVTANTKVANSNLVSSTGTTQYFLTSVPQLDVDANLFSSANLYFANTGDLYASNFYSNNRVSSTTFVSKSSQDIGKVNLVSSNNTTGLEYGLSIDSFGEIKLPNKSISDSGTCTRVLMSGAASTYTPGTSDATPSITTSTATVLSTGITNNGYVTYSLPFQINFNGTNYTNVFIGSNGYLTFGSGSSVNTNLGTPSSLGIPALVVSGGNNSAQKITAYTTSATSPNRVVKIRYEGNSNKESGSAVSDMVWDVTFYENVPGRMDVNVYKQVAGKYSYATNGTAVLGTWTPANQFACRYTVESSIVSDKKINLVSNGYSANIDTNGTLTIPFVGNVASAISNAALSSAVFANDSIINLASGVNFNNTQTVSVSATYNPTKNYSNVSFTSNTKLLHSTDSAVGNPVMIAGVVDNSGPNLVYSNTQVMVDGNKLVAHGLFSYEGYASAYGWNPHRIDFYNQSILKDLSLTGSLTVGTSYGYNGVWGYIPTGGSITSPAYYSYASATDYGTAMYIDTSHYMNPIGTSNVNVIKAKTISADKIVDKSNTSVSINRKSPKSIAIIGGDILGFNCNYNFTVNGTTSIQYKSDNSSGLNARIEVTNATNHNLYVGCKVRIFGSTKTLNWNWGNLAFNLSDYIWTVNSIQSSSAFTILLNQIGPNLAIAGTGSWGTTTFDISNSVSFSVLHSMTDRNPISLAAGINGWNIDRIYNLTRYNETTTRQNYAMYTDLYSTSPFYPDVRDSLITNGYYTPDGYGNGTASYKDDATPINPDIVVWNGFRKDIVTDVSYSTIVANIQSMANTALYYGSAFVISTGLPFDSSSSGYTSTRADTYQRVNSWITQFASKTPNVILWDVLWGTVNTTTWGSSDYASTATETDRITVTASGSINLARYPSSGFANVISSTLNMSTVYRPDVTNGRDDIYWSSGSTNYAYNPLLLGSGGTSLNGATGSIPDYWTVANTGITNITTSLVTTFGPTIRYLTLSPQLSTTMANPGSISLYGNDVASSVSAGQTWQLTGSIIFPALSNNNATSVKFYIDAIINGNQVSIDVITPMTDSSLSPTTGWSGIFKSSPIKIPTGATVTLWRPRFDVTYASGQIFSTGFKIGIVSLRKLDYF